MMLNYDRNGGQGPIYDNIKGITDFETWERLEFDATQQRIARLGEKPSLVKQTFDADHLRALHRYIFQDCYPWAGELRDNGGRTGVCWNKTRIIDGEQLTAYYTADAFIPSRLGEIGKMISKENGGKGYTLQQFISFAARVSDRINEIHMFREGNSRTKRMFLSQMANAAGFDMNFEQLKMEEVSNTEFKSFVKNDLKMLEGLYSKITTVAANSAGQKRLDNMLRTHSPIIKSNGACATNENVHVNEYTD